MKSCPAGAILNHEELIVLERACSLAAKLGEMALQSKTVPVDQRQVFRSGIKIYARYQRAIARVRKAKRRA